MNALKSLEEIPDLETIDNKNDPKSFILKRQIQRQKKQYRSSHLEQGIEASIKIIINSLLIFYAFTNLTKLLPYHQEQQEKLAEIRQEVQATEARVNKLKENFNYTFDSRQTKQIMEKNSHKVDPNQRRIFFIQNNNK